MATIVIMPRQGQSVESCVITAWNKKVGDRVAEGDILFSYETDKSSFDEKSTVDGVMLAVYAEEGDDVPCLDPVCAIGEEDEKVEIPAAGQPGAKTDEKPAAETAPASAPAAGAPAAAATGTTEAAAGFMKISPRAKNLAAKTDADLLKAVPTGPNGRIIERDINALLDGGFTVAASTAASVTDAKPETAPPAPTAAAYTDVKITNIRKVIAKSMHASLANMAQLTLNSSFDASKLLDFRARLKEKAEAMGLENITLNDMVLYAVAKTLKKHPDLNAHYLEDEGVLRRFADVNLGIAVDTERGLLVPTLAAADKLTLNGLAKASRGLIKGAQAGTLPPDSLRGGSFTVTNLGSLGVESFTPVINPPQTGILGVDTLSRRIKEVNGTDVFYTAMGLSLTFDHRALDGAPAARFLSDVCAALENFDLLMAV